jgi:hypothetical protein
VVDFTGVALDERVLPMRNAGEQHVAVGRSTEKGLPDRGKRHPYVMTLLYIALVPTTALIGIIAFVDGATLVGFTFGVVFVFSSWQHTWWQARTGHGTISHRFAFDAGAALGLPEWIVGLLGAYFFIVCAIVVPAVAILGFFT